MCTLCVCVCVWVGGRLSGACKTPVTQNSFSGVISLIDISYQSAYILLLYELAFAIYSFSVPTLLNIILNSFFLSCALWPVRWLSSTKLTNLFVKCSMLWVRKLCLSLWRTGRAEIFNSILTRIWLWWFHTKEYCGLVSEFLFTS